METSLEVVVLQAHTPRVPRVVRVEVLVDGSLRVDVDLADLEAGVRRLHTFDLDADHPAIPVVLAITARPPDELADAV